MPTVPHETAIQRLMSKVDTSAGLFACWPWKGANDGKSGYGHLAYNRKWVKAHRLAYMLLVGPIPDGMDVLHTCDNPPCCNPQHLIPGTHADNMQDRERKGRHNAPHGERHHKAKVTEQDVRAIRSEHAQGIALNVIARRYGITPEQIGSIVHRKSWRHVE
jgi:hypothetical protein